MFTASHDLISSLTGLAVCSFIGIGFGWYPAWKAAALHPIDALCWE
jgi:putative ABC transport system permease protein